MATREQLEFALAEVGRLIGLPDLALDEQGMCAVEIAGVATVNIYHDGEKQHCMLFAELGRLPQSGREAALEDMLAANVLWRGTKGGTLAFDPPSSTALMEQKITDEELRGQNFQRLLEAFIADVKAWRDTLARPGARSGQDAGPKGEELPYFSIRV